MVSLYFQLAFFIHGLLQRHAPTNKLVRVVRARTGPPWLPAVTLLGSIGYLYAASICSAILARGGPGWVNLLVLLFSWNMIKLGVAGVIHVAKQGWGVTSRVGYRTRPERHQSAVMGCGWNQVSLLVRTATDRVRQASPSSVARSRSSTVSTSSRVPSSTSRAGTEPSAACARSESIP